MNFKGDKKQNVESFGEIRRRRRREIDAKQKTFSRGKTIAGATPSKIKRLDKTAMKTATPREAIHRLARIRKKTSFFLAFLICLAFLLLFLIWQFTASVYVNLGNAGHSISDADKKHYGKLIQDYLRVNVDERFRFSLNHKNLNAYVKAKSPEISSVTQQSFVGLGETSFNIELRKPVAVWESGGKKRYVDSHGVLFEKNYFDEPEITIVDNSGLSKADNSSVASNRFISFSGRAVSLAKKFGMEIQSIIIPPHSTRNVEVRFKSADYPIILTVDESPAPQIENGIRAISYLNNGGERPEYIDARVDGKVFYK